MFGNELDNLFGLMDGGSSTKVRGSNKTNKRQPSSSGSTVFDFLNGFLKKDEFTPHKPLLEFFPDTSKNPGGLNGIVALLKMITGLFGSTAGNSSPMFRMAIADWAVGVLTQASAMIEHVLQDSVLKKSPLRGMAENLSGVVKGLLGIVKGFFSEQQGFVQSNKELGKNLQEPAKPA